jgi:integrase
MKRPRKQVEQAGYVEGPKDGSYFLRYWSEPDANGKRIRRAVEVGSKNQFRSKEEANLSVEAAVLRRQINAGVLGKTMGQVIALYEKEAMPARSNRYKTVRALLRHCLLQWADEPIAKLADPSQAKRIEGWLMELKSLPRTGYATTNLSYLSKMDVYSQMHILLNFAMMRGFIPSTINPMTFVKLKQDAIIPRRQTMTKSQMWQFFDDPTIPKHVKVMAHVARMTGLRISEIRGLTDQDFDLDKMTITVSRGVCENKVDRPKSLKSSEPIPLPQELYKILSEWLKSDEFVPTPDGWFFASPYTNFPWDASGIQRYHMTPWGRAHGIKKFGWHTFRHSFKQYLKDAKVPLDEIKQLMRHSRIDTTDGYGSGVDFDTLREAQLRATEVFEKPRLVAPKKRWA